MITRSHEKASATDGFRRGPGEGFVVLDGGLFRDPAVEAVDAAGADGDEEAERQGEQHTGIDQQIVGVRDVGEIHVCHPVKHHHGNAEGAADADHQPVRSDRPMKR